MVSHSDGCKYSVLWGKSLLHASCCCDVWKGGDVFLQLSVNFQWTACATSQEIEFCKRNITNSGFSQAPIEVPLH
jgi:hypothetical protein